MAISLTHTTVAVGTDAGNGEIAKAQWNENHTLTQATERLLGRTTAGVGATEEISVGTGLSLSGGTLTNTVTATAPGGSNTQLQFNSSGAFAGASGLTTNGTELTIASGTKTASAPVIDASQTWNASGVTFTGLKFNVPTDSSASGSLLMDLQVGGSSAFNVSKGGSLKLGRNASGTNVAGSNVTIAGSQGTGTGAGGSIIFQVAPAGSNGTAQNALATLLTLGADNYVSTNNYNGFEIAGSGASANWVKIGSGGSNGIQINRSTWLTAFSSSGRVISLSLGFASSAANVGAASADTILERDAGNTLALRNGNNGQIFNIYGRYTSATNHERFFISAPTTSGDTVLVGTDKGSGGGSARALALQTDGTTRLTIGSTGGLTLADAQDIAVGSTTGTKIGTATTQKIGFFNKAPVVQPTAVADATDAATVITQLNALLSRMRDLGLIAT